MKKMSTRLVIAIVLSSAFLTIFFNSCKKERYSNRIIGEWFAQDRGSQKYVFNEDGKYLFIYNQVEDSFNCKTLGMPDYYSFSYVTTIDSGTYKIRRLWPYMFLDLTYYSAGGWFSSPGYRTSAIKIIKLKKDKMVFDDGDRNIEYTKCE